MPTQVRSHAKINLGLAIGPPRSDGFHGLTTVYQTLEAHDVVTVSARPAAASRIQLTSNDRRVPTDSRNTAWKMVSLVLEEIGAAAEIQIHIEKRLPIQGGLGAGSANAVAALVGLEHELGIATKGRALPPFEQKALEGWGTGADWARRRMEIAAQVGSDVPLFLVGGTVLGLDRGQQVYPLPDLEPLWCVLAIPGTGVSTPQAFRDWDALCVAEGLTAETGTDKLNRLSQAYLSAFEVPKEVVGQGSSGVLSENELNREDLAGPLGSALVRTGITSWIQNDFERVVFPQYPSLAEIKRILAAPATPGAGSCLWAALSGSGSALFGLYEARGDAEAAVNRLTDQAQGVDVRITQSLPRADYWRTMILK
jgi:4-diphosphocytidyl-2-C-methyl-D-erythritol kinase